MANKAQADSSGRSGGLRKPETRDSGQHDRCRGKPLLWNSYVMQTGCRLDDLPHAIAVSPKLVIGVCWNTNDAGLAKILASLTNEANRKGRLNLTNAYHDASVLSLKGRE